MVAVVGTAILTIRRREPKGALRDTSATLMIVVFLGFLGSFGVQIRCGCDTPGQDGAWLLLIVVLVAKAADIGGYLVGAPFGRHKLVPTISPAKSIEGAVGGMLCSAGVAVAFTLACSGAVALSARGFATASIGIGSSGYLLLDEMTRAFSLSHAEAGLHPAIRAFFFGILVSVAAQSGDLIESCFKRDAGVKDSGNVIPQFGGILDLIDSLVPAMPVAWFLLTAVWDIV
jgi:phosphatidate cytidylyltransferase